MTEKEILACIALVVIAWFFIADLLRTEREDRQQEADMRKLREENARLYKECVVLRHGQKEAEDGKKERNEKV